MAQYESFGDAELWNGSISEEIPVIDVIPQQIGPIQPVVDVPVGQTVIASNSIIQQQDTSFVFNGSNSQLRGSNTQGFFITMPALANTKEAAKILLTDVLHWWATEKLPEKIELKELCGCVEQHTNAATDNNWHCHVVGYFKQRKAISGKLAEKLFTPFEHQFKKQGQSVRNEFLRDRIAAYRYISKLTAEVVKFDKSHELYMDPEALFINQKNHAGPTVQKEATNAKAIDRCKSLIELGPLECVRQGIFHPSMLCNLQKAYLQLKVSPDILDRDVYYIYGGSGQGKTYGVKVQKKFGTVFDKQPNNQWFDGLQDQDCLLLDDCDAGIGYMMWRFKRWLEGYVIPVEIKGAYAMLAVKYVVLTSNHPPMDVMSKLDKDNNLIRPLPADMQAIVRRLNHIWKVDNPFYMDKQHADYHKFIVIEQTMNWQTGEMTDVRRFEPYAVHEVSE